MEKSKSKRIILIYGGLSFPFILGIIVFLFNLYILQTPSELAPLYGLVALSLTGIITWSIAAIYYKILRFNCSLSSSSMINENLIFIDTGLVHSYIDIDTPTAKAVGFLSAYTIKTYTIYSLY